jgi:hypothetical protein
MEQVNLWHVGLAAFGVFALLHFIFVPRAQAALAQSRSMSALKVTLTFAMLDLLRTVSLCVLIASALTIGVLLYVQAQGGTTASELALTLDRVRDLREQLQELSPGLGAVSLVLLVLALAILSRRAARMRTKEALERAWQIEVERVLDEQKQGKWEELSPTAEMNEHIEKAGPVAAELDALRHQAAAETDEARRKQIEERVGELERLLGLRLQAYQYLDVQRRMRVEAMPLDLAPRAPTTLLGRIGTFFISRGLLNTMRGATRLAFIAGVLLLVPSLLALGAAPLGGAVETRQALIESLYLEANAKEAEKTFEDESRQFQQVSTPSEAPLSAEDAQLAQQMASYFEQSVAHVQIRSLGLAETFARSARPAGSGTAVRQVVVRERILQQFNTAHPESTRVHVLGEGDHHAGMTRAMAQMEADLAHGRPVTPVGQRFQADLERNVIRRSPEQWTVLKRQFTQTVASFQQPASVRQVQTLLINNVIGEALHAGGGAPSPLAQELGYKLDRAMQEQAYRYHNNRFLAGMQSEGLGGAVRAVEPPHMGPLFPSAHAESLKNVVQRVPASASALDETIRRYPPSMARLSEAHVDTRKASALVSEMSSRGLFEGRRAEGLANSLSSFDDYFPGRQGAEAATARGRALAAAGQAVPPSSAGGSHTMSRSYARLTGFRKVGGVLIGRDPENAGATLDFTDVTWEKASDKIRLQLTRADGKRIVLGPFNQSVVHLALAYVADGRPVAVTMTTAEPLHELQIQLHPALVDTSLGCRAIEIDRFVDATSGQSAERKEASELVLAHAALYRLAWAANFVSARRSYTGGNADARLISDSLDGARELLRSDAQKEAAAAALRHPVRIGDPNHSPLTTKREFYDRGLVQRMQRCAGPRPELDAFLSCIGEGAPRVGSSLERLAALAAPPPRFEIWSGVRERAFTLDPELHFIGATAPDRLWPFDFILQTAFASPAWFVDPNKVWYKNEEQAEAYADEKPWSFPALQPVLAKSVGDVIATRLAERDVFEGMRQFVLAQRLFRVALSGGLGERFPIDKLPKLVADTSSAVANGVRTLRWNSRAGSIEAEFRAELSRSRFLASAAAAPLRQAAEQCAAVLTDLLDKDGRGFLLASMPQAEFEAACTLGAVSVERGGLTGVEPRVVEALTQASERAIYTRRLRAALGLAKDDEQIAQQSRQGRGGPMCAPL